MSEKLGHLNSSERRAVRLGQASRSVHAEEQRLKREFSQTIGRRTFALINAVGLANKSGFISEFAGPTSKIVRSSNPLEFALPNDDRQYSLRFELSHMPQRFLWLGMSPRHVYRVGTELTRRDEQGERKQLLELHDREYVNGTPLDNHELGYSRGAIPDYTAKTDLFTNILTFAEAIVAGQTPALPLDDSDNFDYFQSLTGEAGALPAIEARGAHSTKPR